MTPVWGSLLETLVWASVATYAVKQLRTAVGLFANDPLAGGSEEVSPIPEDLIALAMTHREAWAQEDTLRVIREQYEDLKDWNRVRAAMNVGRIDG